MWTKKPLLRMAYAVSVILAAAAAQAQYNPVPLTPGSFQYDIVLEKTAPAPLENYVNCTVDAGTNDLGNTFFEQGYIQGIPYVGLPPHGATFTSVLNPNQVFKMAPSYLTNNIAYVGSANIPGTSTLQTQVVSAVFNVVAPASYQALSILWTAGGADGLVDVTVHHQDGSSETSQITTVDWFNTTASYAYIAMGRCAVDGVGSLNTIRSTTQTKVFSTDLSLNGNASPVTSVSFAYNGSGTSANYRFFGFGMSGSTDNVNYSPIDVSGYNYDGIVESDAKYKAYYVQGYNVTMDGGANGNGNTFYEQGFCTLQGVTPLNRGGQASTGTTGLPHPGTTITSGNYTFQMPPTYAGNDCVFIGNYPVGTPKNGPYSNRNDYTVGSFTITSPQPYAGFSILNAAGNGPCGINYTISYSDGNTDSGTISSLNWFQADASLVYSCGGRVGVDSPAINNLNGASPTAAIYHTELPVTHPSSLATNISFTWVSGGRAALFSVSASTDGTIYSPIAVTGYDADIVVEKEQPFWHAGVFTNTTATMDQGVANGNWTLFERGWITNGYGRDSGLPPAGSTITSLQAANRFYQIQSYTAPNGTLINSSSTSANLTPASPASYSAFAVLTAGGSIGAGNSMSNLCILQHADGVNETNFFLGKDWFDTTVPAAFICNGRGDTRGGVGGNIGANPQNPRLFESFFQVTDAGSPVTNIILQYVSGGGSCYVMAVSATAGAVQPFVGQTVISPANPSLEGSNLVLRATVGGTPPISYQWQYSPDGANWNNLADAGNVSGVTETNLQINGSTWTNSGQYRLIASNIAGSATNIGTTLTVYSSLPDVPVATDPLEVYQPNGGSSPAGAEVIHAIDHLVGTNSAYINTGSFGGSSPFAGPVGFIVAPRAGMTTVSAARFYPTESNPQNDPANWTLEGSIDGGATWSLITSNAFTLPAGRNAIVSTAVNPLTQSQLELHFSNTIGYTSYRVAFWNTANDAAATAVAIGEVELLGTNTYAAPIIARQPVDATVWQGGNPTFTVLATGAPLPLTYQWSRGTVAPIGIIAGATSSSYTLVNAQAADNGATFSCTVGTTQGSTPSSSATLHVITGTPTTPYPVAIMADQPLGFWRLGEGPDNGGGNNGAIAFDYFGGFNGSYSNTVLAQAGYNPTLDSDTAAGFGIVSLADSYVGGIEGIDFSAPTNNAVAFSVEAWVLFGSTVPVSGAGIITKGYGGGGEQFNLDCGSGGAAANFRFFVRDAGGNTHGTASGTIGPATPLGPFPNANPAGYSWHHVVGVCDEPNSNVVLYVDGISNAAATGVLPSNGILNSPLPVTIGSRKPNVFTDSTLQYNGTIDEVAIYKQALTPSQVLSHYYAAHPLPVFTLQPPATMNYSANGPLVIDASAYGPPALTFQWYQSPDQFTWSAVGSQTSPTFNLASTPANLGPYLELVATDPYGSVTSSVVQVTVFASAPQITSNLVPHQPGVQRRVAQLVRYRFRLVATDVSMVQERERHYLHTARRWRAHRRVPEQRAGDYRPWLK